MLEEVRIGKPASSASRERQSLVQVDASPSSNVHHPDDDNGPRANNKTTDGQTMMHMLKANIGTGVLAMPMAFKNVGLWVGFLLVPVIGVICTYCMNILIESHNHLCDRFNYESLDYDQVAALSFALGPKFLRKQAKSASYIVLMFLLLSQIGFCCVFVTFVVENIQVSMANLFQVRWTSAAYLLIIFPVVALTSSTSNLSYMARISTTANILQLAGLALIFVDLFQFQPVMLNSTINANQTQPTPADIRIESISSDFLNGLPLFFATAVYAFEGIGVVLPLVKEMQYPSRIAGLTGVLNTSMYLIALLYMAMGFFGYSKYGQFVQGSISLNLPRTTLNEFVRLIYAIALCLSYSIQFYVPWTIIWPFIDESLFYSYRPREARDKLQILDKLSAKNEWDVSQLFADESRDDAVVSKEPQYKPQQRHNNAANNVVEDEDLDVNSTDSTLATSYSMSLHQSLTTGPLTGYCTIMPRSCLLAFNQTACQYGSIAEARRTRNRLEDVAKHDDDTCEVPDVQVRPPPQSMRGRRRVVRFSLVVFFVSLTFIASALIPRLDLFISLVGAFASSSLAIIFPAVIQLSTFWSIEEDEADEDKEQQSTTSRQRLLSRGTFKKSCCWYLFFVKNMLLVIFGLLGLITGTWITISKIVAIYDLREISDEFV